MARVPDRTMEHLLAEGDFVRALARGLVGVTDVDDLTQDAWLAAVRHGRDVREPRPWLARVVRRLASNRRRDARRREVRDQTAGLARPLAGPSTDAILACEEVRRRVVTAVLGLDEPYRATVLARFYECLPTEAIAARAGVAPATVRSRLKRGLDALRARLDAEHGGARAAWAAPLQLLGRHPSPIPLHLPPTGVPVAVSTSKKLFVAAALMLAAFSIWLVAADAWRVGEPVAPAGDERVATAAGEGAAAIGTGRLARREANAGGAADRSRTRRDVPYPVLDEPTVEIGVRVLDAATNAPVAGAEVVYLPFQVDFWAAAARRDRALQEGHGSDAWVERVGDRTATDGAGTARLCVPLSGTRVLARAGNRAASVNLDPGDLLAGESATIWLEPERTLRVRLVDADSGAPLSGRMIEFGNAATGTLVPESCGYGGMLGPADTDGMIQVPAAGDRGSFRVRPWTVGRAGWTPLDLPAALARVTELRCPATGSLTVELQTPSGRRMPAAIEARVDPVVDGGNASSEYGPVGWRQMEQGIYRVPDIEVGQSLRVTAYVHDLPGSRAERTITGPMRAGEDVHVVLTTATEPCELRARLCFGDAVPAADCAVEIAARTARGSNYVQAITDAGGNLRWIAPLGTDLNGEIRVSGPPAQHDSRPRCRFHLDVAAAGGVHDLGTLHLVAGSDVVVAGRLDIGGDPWSGPAVEVRVEVPGADGEWRQLERVQVHPGHDATFELGGATEAAVVRVGVAPASHFVAPGPIVVARGTRDVVVPIARGLPLRAGVLAPAAYVRAVTCRAVRQDGESMPADGHEVDDAGNALGPTRADARLLDCDGELASLVWPSLPPGTYRVDVGLPGIAGPLATFASVQVAPGVPPDPRLERIDLRDRARTLSVRVAPVPAGPRPITDGGVLAFASGSPDAPRHGLMFDAGGGAELLVGPDPVDVVVAVPGFRLWRAEAVAGSALQVQLEPCLEVPFRLAPHVAERFAGFGVRVTLDPRDRDAAGPSPAVVLRRPGRRDAAVETRAAWLQRLADTGIGTIADSSLAHGTVPISAPGAFELALAVQGVRQLVHVTGGFTGWRRNPVSPARVTVTGEHDPEIVIDVEDEVVTKVLDELARQR